MLKRTLTGAALMTVLITVLLFLPTIYTALLVAVMVMIAADELMKTTGLVTNPRLISYASLMAICVAFGSYFEPDYPIMLAVFLLLTVLCFSELLVSHGKLPFQQIAITLIAGLLIPFMLSSLVRLQMMENGRFLVVAVFIMAFMPDVGAYLVGSAIGRHKLCPNISPKKTVEGLIGGILGGIVGMILFAIVLRYAFGLSVNYLYMGIYGVVGAGAATFGDLIFSVIKRQTGIKDYGKLLPGHGGILDRFDSVAMVGPVAELLFLILPLAVR